MSVWSVLDGAFKNSGAILAGDVQGIGQSVIQGLQVEIKTNLGPAFFLGGQYNAPTSSDQAPVQSSPGLLSALGIQVGAQVLSADGSVLFHYGDLPPTDIVRASVAAALVLGVSFLVFRGVRSFF